MFVCFFFFFFLHFIDVLNSFFFDASRLLLRAEWETQLTRRMGAFALFSSWLCASAHRRLRSGSYSGAMSSSLLLLPLLLATLPPLCVGPDAILSSLPSLSQSSSRRIRLLHCVLLIQRSTQPRHPSQLAANPLSGFIQAGPHTHRPRQQVQRQASALH